MRVLVLRFLILLMLLTSFTVDRPQRFEKKQKVEVKETVLRVPWAMAILRFIGLQYVGFKMGEIFEILETKLAGFAKTHLQEIWYSYTQYGENNNGYQLYKEHYAACPICKGTGEMIEDFEQHRDPKIMIEYLEKMSRIEHQKVLELESTLNQQIRLYDSKFISIEKDLVDLIREKNQIISRLNSIEIQQAYNDQKIRELEEKVDFQHSEISKVQEELEKDVMFLLYKSTSYELVQKIRNDHPYWNIEIKALKYNNERKMIIFVDEMLKKEAYALGEELGIKVKFHEMSGYYGFKDYDLIILF